VGLFWQESVIAVLLSLFFFSKIATQESSARLWAPSCLALTIVWHSLALPYMMPFFALTTAFLCVGGLRPRT
jgi:hypothetical protein